MVLSLRLALKSRPGHRRLAARKPGLVGGGLIAGDALAALGLGMIGLVAALPLAAFSQDGTLAPPAFAQAIGTGRCAQTNTACGRPPRGCRLVVL